MDQPKFNTHETTQIEAEHLAALANPHIEQLMTPDQVANLMGVPRETIYTWANAGMFPPPDVRVGNGPRSVRRWLPSTVFAFIHKGRQEKAA